MKYRSPACIYIHCILLQRRTCVHYNIINSLVVLYASLQKRVHGRHLAVVVSTGAGTLTNVLYTHNKQRTVIIL